MSLSLLINMILYSSSQALHSAKVPMDQIMSGEITEALKRFHCFLFGLMTKQTFGFWTVLHPSNTS